jgi:hypothetical protein
LVAGLLIQRVKQLFFMWGRKMWIELEFVDKNARMDFCIPQTFSLIRYFMRLISIQQWWQITVACYKQHTAWFGWQTGEEQKAFNYYLPTGLVTWTEANTERFPMPRNFNLYTTSTTINITFNGTTCAKSTLPFLFPHTREYFGLCIIILSCQYT